MHNAAVDKGKGVRLRIVLVVLFDRKRAKEIADRKRISSRDFCM